MDVSAGQYVLKEVSHESLGPSDSAQPAGVQIFGILQRWRPERKELQQMLEWSGLDKGWRPAHERKSLSRLRSSQSIDFQQSGPRSLLCFKVGGFSLLSFGRKLNRICKAYVKTVQKAIDTYIQHLKGIDAQLRPVNDFLNDWPQLDSLQRLQRVLQLYNQHLLVTNLTRMLGRLDSQERPAIEIVVQKLREPDFTYHLEVSARLYRLKEVASVAHTCTPFHLSYAEALAANTAQVLEHMKGQLRYLERHTLHEGENGM